MKKSEVHRIVLKYYEKSRSLFLALEDEGEIGILTKK
jgi:hypothetical protein